MAELKVKITSDVAEAAQGLTAIEIRSKQLEANIAKLNNVIANTASQRKLTSALAALSQQQRAYNKVVDSMKDKMGQLPSVTNQATFTLNNFTRVVQDAPYGIRGVANNIDPLVESFLNLKKQTGSTTGALSGMLTALSGPAGILLAVSAVSSALVFFGDKIFSAKKEVDDLNLALIQFNDNLDGIDKDLKKYKEELDFQNEIGKLNNQVAGLSNSTVDLADAQSKVGNSLNYIDRLNYYIGSLEDGYKNTTKEATDFLEQIRNIGKTDMGLGIQAGRVGLEQLDASGLKSYNKDLKALYEGFLITGRINLEFTKNLSKEEQDRFALLAANANKYTDLLDERTSALRTNNILQAQLIDLRNRQLFEAYENEIQFVKTKVEEFKKLDLRLIKSPFEELNLFKPAGSLSTFRDQQAVIQRIQDVFLDPKLKRRIEQIGFGADISFRITPNFKINELPKSVEKDLQDINKSVEENLTPDAKKIRGAFKEVKEEFNTLTNDINDILKNIELEGIATIGLAIGEAISVGGIQNSFASFGEVVAAGLEAIGRKLIVIGKLSEIVQQALKKLFTPEGGPLAIVAGVGLIAAASALRGSLSKGIQARALGGPVSGGSPYLVGERGPELFVPSVSGGIVPNNAVGSFMGGRMGSGSGGSVLRGQDILLAYARTQRSQLRVNG